MISRYRRRSDLGKQVFDRKQLYSVVDSIENASFLKIADENLDFYTHIEKGCVNLYRELGYIRPSHDSQMYPVF
jgi:hypothetical protein